MSKYLDESRTAEFATKVNSVFGKKVAVAQNTLDIAQNTRDIATNAANIATNATNIATNASNIAQNTSDIATNAQDIADLQELAFEIDENGDLMPPL